MSKQPKLPHLVESIGRNYLDFNPEQDGESKASHTHEQIGKALEAAYEAGRTEARIELTREAFDSTMLFWQLMETLPDYVYFKDLESRFLCVNHAIALYFGMSHPDELIGKSDFDIFQPDLAQAKFEVEQEVIRTGKGWVAREELDIQDDGQEKWVLTSKLPLRDAEGKVCGTFGISRDITENKRFAMELDRQRNLLSSIIQILPCRIFVRDTEGRFLLINEEYRKVFGLKSREDAVGKRLTDIRDNERARSIEREDQKVMKEGKTIINQLEFDKSLLGEDYWVLMSKTPLRSPLGEVEGLVGMTLDISEQKAAEDRARAAQKALQAKNQQFEAELFVARQLQEHLMSFGFDENRLYSMVGASWSLETSYIYEPSHHLAGDFFYIVPIAKGRFGILVCDVMGHGVKAALVTMLLRGLLLEVPDILTYPGKVLTHLNQALVPLAEDPKFPRFVTAIYTVVDLNRGNVRIASAGHPSPLWRVEDQEGRRFENCPCSPDDAGPALGLISGETYHGFDISLNQQTEFLFYTDGIIEQKMGDGKEFGIEGLKETVISHDCDRLPDQLQAIPDSLKKTLGSEALSDDLCIVAVRITPKE